MISLSGDPPFLVNKHFLISAPDTYSTNDPCFHLKSCIVTELGYITLLQAYPGTWGLKAASLGSILPSPVRLDIRLSPDFEEGLAGKW